MLDINRLLKDHDFAELIKQSGISFVIRIFGQILGLLLTFIIARYFGADSLGDYVLAIVILRIFTLFSKLGTDIFSIRFIASFAKQGKWVSIQRFRNKILFIVIFSSIFFSCLMYFSSSHIANLIQANNEHIRLGAFFILPMALFMLHYQSLRGLKRIAEFSFFYRMSQAFFSIIFIFIISKFLKETSVPFYAYLLSLFVVSVLALFSFIYHFKKCSVHNESEKIEALSLTYILRISLPLMFAQLVQFLMAFTDKLMLGNMMTTHDVGVYFTAFKLSMIASVGLMSINSIAAPKFAELYGHKDLDGLKNISYQSSKVIFWITIPLILCFFSFPEFILGIFGEDFKLGVSALIFLSVGKLISSLCGSVGNLLQMTGNQLIFMKCLLCGAIINIILNLLLIPSYGINGAAISSMVSLSSWNILMVYFVKRELGFNMFYLPLLRKL